MNRRTGIAIGVALACGAVVAVVAITRPASVMESTAAAAVAASSPRASLRQSARATVEDFCRHPLLPLAMGTRWRYVATSPGSPASPQITVEREVIALERAGADLVATVRSTLSVAGRSDTTSHEIRVSCTPDGAVDDVLDDLGEDTMFLPVGPPPRLARVLSAGMTFERAADVVLRLPTLSADAARVNIEIRARSRVARRESVETPIGSREAWVVEREDDFTLRPDAEIVAEAEAEGAPPLPEMPSRTVRSYLVEGIGLVRRETLQAGTRVHWKLEQFSAGGGGL